MPSFCASPPVIDAAVNSAMPVRKVFRRPHTSPIRAPSSSRPPKVSVYALTTHDKSALENDNELWILDSAIFTIVESSTTIN